MNIAAYINLVSALCGVVGTLILYKNSYALEPSEGAVFDSDDVAAHNKEVKARNLKRLQLQKAGLACILAGFVLAGLAQFFSFK